MAACRSCNAPMIWTRTKASGSWMPVDSEPVPGGNVTLLSGNDYADGVPRSVVNGGSFAGDGAKQLGFDDPDGQALGYVSHFSSCPAASEHRRRP